MRGFPFFQVNLLDLFKALKLNVLDNSDNRLSAGAENDFVLGRGGADSLAGNDGNDTLLGGSGNDLLLGGAGTDRIDGGAGNDEIYGGKDADRLFGGSGSDTLSGDFGADTLSGGAGRDTFVFVARTADATDVITDFSFGETIQLKGFAGQASYETVNGNDVAVSIDGHVIALLEDAAGRVSDATFTYV